jgi:hypothetical protein
MVKTILRSPRLVWGFVVGWQAGSANTLSQVSHFAKRRDETSFLLRLDDLRDLLSRASLELFPFQSLVIKMVSKISKVYGCKFLLKMFPEMVMEGDWMGFLTLTAGLHEFSIGKEPPKVWPDDDGFVSPAFLTELPWRLSENGLNGAEGLFRVLAANQHPIGVGREQAIAGIVF